jgi:predicted nucleic acid-binding protein
MGLVVQKTGAANRDSARSRLASEPHVRAWVALFDDAHVFSARANAFVETAGVQIATSPIVENGVIRVMSLPSYGRRGGVPLQRVRERLREACAALDHAFGPTTSLCARKSAASERKYR